jgi:hypothetical protein
LETDRIAFTLRKKIAHKYLDKRARLSLVVETLKQYADDIPKLNTALQRLEVLTTPVKKERVKIG